MSAVDIALWDLRAPLLGVSIADAVGGAHNVISASPPDKVSYPYYLEVSWRPIPFRRQRSVRAGAGCRWLRRSGRWWRA